LTTIDFTKAIQDAKGASFEALPQGDYDVEVAKADAVTSQNGKPMIKTTMRVVSGPYERRPIINQFVFSGDNPTAVAIFFRHMKAFGLDEAFFAALGSVNSLEPVATALVNRRARLTIGHREWQGETRNEVKAVKPYTGAPATAGPAGPAGPLTPNGGPAPLPPRPAGPAPLPPAAPAAPQVRSVPQPPAPTAPPAPVAPPAVPTAPAAPSGTEATDGYAAAPSPSYEPPVATSEPVAGPSTPPALPY
jgi:hypothetical protein